MKHLFITLAVLFAALAAKPQNTSHIDFAKLPSLAWKFKTDSAVMASPVAEGTTVYIGSLDGNLYALNLVTGKMSWKFKTGGQIRSTACIYKNSLMFVSGDGLFYCLDKRSGKTLWTFKTRGERQYELFSFADYYQSSPIVADGWVYFGSGDGNVYALNAGNGSLRWQFKTGSVVHATPAIDKGKLFIGSFDGYFYALDAANGQLIWKFKSVGHNYFPKGEMQGSPAVFNGLVYVGSRDYNLYAIDEDGGYCRWNRPFPRGWAMATPQFKDSVMYVGTSDDYEMHVINPRSGATKLKTNLRFNIFAPCSFTDSMYYVGTLMGKLFGVSVKDGSIRWSFNTDNYNKNRFSYLKENDDYRDDIGQIFTAEHGQLRSLYQLGSVFSQPCIAQHYIVFTSMDGNVYCLTS
ncbi:hypothetical protein BEL04_19760 [Mucilaginibacter sp. PPCGB 2223]|uniref:outer membrane protein assembly factor BamB family protein n=1 Tax=Mucilaginibacter sp. PPCGB 2223 TaxID=1886027 RepID=UPI0008244F6B|nr:PQQ-binding-like beta-propeller repeat protein [Mucilaginibacter sp. PPCGB 2223]OCX50958.1 hypothetical protein BEL04_19760 [Mucilaginibacter sp. PPCGB 2223]